MKFCTLKKLSKHNLSIVWPPTLSSASKSSYVPVLSWARALGKTMQTFHVTKHNWQLSVLLLFDPASLKFW